MPRRSRGPYKWFDEKRGTWTIIDGKHNRRTSFSESQVKEADDALKAYLGEKHVVKVSDAPALADVLAAYLDEHIPSIADRANTEYRIGTLNEWWGDKKVSDINAGNCRDYAKSRPGSPGARRDLEILRAAVNYWHKHKQSLPVIPAVILPEKPSPREDWLTREEFARFLWAARHLEHLKRFLLLGWYTGSRSAVLFGMNWELIDMGGRIMRRKPHGARKSKKGAPPLPIGDKLYRYLRRWKRLDAGRSRFLVHYNGERVTKLRRSFQTARKAAQLPETVTPHTLRHSCATWLMKNGANYKDAAQFLGMSVETLVRVYGHHHPDWLKGVADLL